MERRAALGMKQLPHRARWIKPVGGALIAASAAVGISASPMVMLVSSAGLWGLVAVWALPTAAAVTVPLACAILFPFDNVVGLGGPIHGFPVLAVGGILVVAGMSRRGRVAVPLEDWDLLGLAGLLAFATLVNAGAGELRGILLWASACLFLIWLRGEEKRSLDLAGQVTTALVIAGVVGGTAAIVEYVGGVSVRQLIPLYEPHELSFSATLGTRASGISGHPLRLGTITMLSSLILLSRAFAGSARRSRFIADLSLLALSMSGLVLSGARGSWLGFLIGGTAVIGLRLSREGQRTLWRALLILAVCAGAVWLTGLGGVVQERIIGGAAHPASLAQRAAALITVARVWATIPLFGVGFGGAADVVGKAGMQLPNLENEYLRVFLAGGYLGPILLFASLWRRIKVGVRQPRTTATTALTCAFIALAVNMATYNLFSWSAGASLFFVIAAVIMPTTATSRRPREVTRSISS